MGSFDLTKNRINWIDVAKGIGIILVVFSHTSSLGAVKVIFAFHMPLFFILAGIVFSSKTDFKTFLIKKFRTLYVPFLVFLTADYVIFALRKILSGETIMIKDFVFFYLIQASGTNLSSEAYLYNGPIWFLCALFFAEIVFYWITKIKKPFIISLIGLAGAIASNFIKRDLPFAMSYIFPIVAFMALGYLIKDKCMNISLSKKGKALLGLFAIVAAVSLSVFSLHNDFVGMRSFEYGNTILFFINAVLGSSAVILFSVLLSKNRFLEFWGKNSVYVLCFHLLFCNILLPDIANRIFKQNSSIAVSPITEIVIVILSFILLYPVTILCNKYLYFIFGRKKQRTQKKNEN